MNIVVDYGNSSAKVGIFENETLLNKHQFFLADELYAFLKKNEAENILVSSVNISVEEIVTKALAKRMKFTLTNTLPLPITNLYATPETLGVDRIAAACGAAAIMPDRNCLVIDAGTCINYEFIDAEKKYWGGAISPGLQMRFDAMHKFTARLPLYEPMPFAPLTGNSTEACMQSGVINGALAEMEGIINRYDEKYTNLGVIICGGDAPFFENKIKPSIFAAPDLILMGLNWILRYNATR